MVNFLTLLFGLFFRGPVDIELSVTADVARVEIEENGQLLAVLEGAPWSFVWEPEPGRLLPHLLVATAFDHRGSVLDRDHRMINIGRDDTPMTLALTPPSLQAPGYLDLRWANLDTAAQPRFELFLDGKNIPTLPSFRAELPPLDLEEVHFVRARLTWPDGELRQTEAAFGGRLGSQISTELSSVVVELERRSLPRLKHLGGWLQSHGETLEIKATEKPEASLWVVRAPNAQDAIDRIARQLLGPEALEPEAHQQLYFRPPRRPSRRSTNPFESSRPINPFYLDVDLHFVNPNPPPAGPVVVDPRAFLVSDELAGEQSGLEWLTLTEPEPRFDSRIAEAVGTAGQLAHASSRRRAVLLILGPEQPDSSRIDPRAVREYLRSLQVPLFVWRVSALAAADQPWGEELLINPLAGAVGLARTWEKAVVALQTKLERQRLIWVEGRHLPQQIELGPAAKGVDFSQ